MRFTTCFDSKKDEKKAAEKAAPQENTAEEETIYEEKEEDTAEAAKPEKKCCCKAKEGKTVDNAVSAALSALCPPIGFLSAGVFALAKKKDKAESALVGACVGTFIVGLAASLIYFFGDLEIKWGEEE